MNKPNLSIVIPTYNERDNVKTLIENLNKLNEDIDILVIDDNSPDKTWEILQNLEDKNYTNTDIINSDKLASDNKYSEIVRNINSDRPSRYNSDSRLLYGASGSSGKVAVFALRLDTYPKPKKSQVFYLGTNDVV